MAAPTFTTAYGMSLGDLEHVLFAAQLSGQNADATVFSSPVITVPVTASIGGVSVATAITADSGNQANATATATLAGVAAKTTFITGFTVTATGATSVKVTTVTLAGVITGTMNYTFVFIAGVTTACTPLQVTFPTPVPASAVNTGIVVTLAASGAGGTNATVNATGFQL